MKRRAFLKGVLGISTAPAFVKADSLMNIYMPKKEIIISDDTILRAGEIAYTDMHSGLIYREDGTYVKKITVTTQELFARAEAGSLIYIRPPPYFVDINSKSTLLG